MLVRYLMFLIFLQSKAITTAKKIAVFYLDMLGQAEFESCNYLKLKYVYCEPYETTLLCFNAIAQ